MDESGGCIFWLIFFFFAGLALIYDGASKYLFIQKVRNLPTSKIRSVAVGLVELFGKALNLKEMKSPIDKTKCVYWRIHAEWYKSGKNGGWRDFYDSRSSNQFLLEDGTGKILIDPKDAKIEIPLDKQYQGYLSGKGHFGFSHKKMDKIVLAFIDSLDSESKVKFMNKSHVDLKVTEYYIAEGDLIYVLGDACIADNFRSEKGHENLIVKKGEFEKVMYISDSSERKILENLNNSVLLTLAAGVGLSTVSLFLLLLNGV